MVFSLAVREAAVLSGRKSGKEEYLDLRAEPPRERGEQHLAIRTAVFYCPSVDSFLLLQF
jgi:hypothetical protein